MTVPIRVAAGTRRLTGSDPRERPSPAGTSDALRLTRARGQARQPLASIPPQAPAAMPWRVRGLGWAASCRRRMAAGGIRQWGSRRRRIQLNRGLAVGGRQERAR